MAAQISPKLDARKNCLAASNGQMPVDAVNAVNTMCAVSLVDDQQADLLEACQRGEREALRLLFEAHKDKVYSLALRSTGDSAAAWDLTQEVFIKVFAKLGEFRQQSKFETWLYRIVINTCIDERRKTSRFVPFDEQTRGGNRVSEIRPQEKNYLRRQVKEAVEGAVSRLTPKVRAAILLRYVEGLSYEEIGEILRCPAGTVAARLNRGHKILARELAGFRGVMP